MSHNDRCRPMPGSTQDRSSIEARQQEFKADRIFLVCFAETIEAAIVWSEIAGPCTHSSRIDG